jgi:DNA invertase Pin-like site-specific DNA recombinase
MARKSRKDQIRAVNSGQPLPEITPQPVKKIYTTVGYARLSILETRDRKDNEALQNQKTLIREYIQGQHNLKLLSIYEDNGETGTNFRRPGFESMMEAVCDGKADCIVVKDLSRFGRNYIEAGNYLEHVFPALGVRFISIGDGYDSADATTTDCLVVALKNLMNQMYSKDISRKSGSVLREKIKRGEFIGGYASYGYIKDPEDRHRIIVDPEAAEVVRSIFQKKLEGVSNAAIVRWLNNSGILSPCCYRHQKGILLDHRYAQPKPWKAETVKNILRSQVYLGHMVQGHRRSEFYAGIPDRLLPQSEWVIVKNTHEAIISQEDFDRVQALCETKRREYYANLGKYDHLGKSENILRGLVYCGDCGRPMVRYKQVVKGKKVSYHYMCPHYAAMLEQSGCAYKFLREDILLDALSQLINKEIEQAVDTVQMAKRLSDGTEGQITARAAELRRLNLELERMETRKKAVMQDFLAGELSCDAYEEIKTCCVRECERLKERILTLRGEQHRQSETLTVDNPWLKTFSGLQLPDRLNRNLACALIQRITIYAENKIDVIFKYQDEREHLLTAINEEEVSA